MEHKRATRALGALSHATRLSIYRLLVQAGTGGKLAGDIAQALNLPGATLSFHLKALSAAKLITAEHLGRSICYRANFTAMNALVGYLTENCCADDTPSERPGCC
ncbi:metalloregulator ArsR/SmtB family transcription factor [Stenotrophomonas rhizophila]|uniref:ArsR family transcriptional regulator n=1 Tax=Stenotrophomonas rhizophila TaxID=216778 RepID=A0AAP5AFU1_9GAMM|nr:metalloregulator ArsR/SmtB family transcription factor [Stenotrophomonas rhizophila]MDQ1107182.1 ArsR family transcriptional regulator [Stenotrophomonas rhizophila]